MVAIVVTLEANPGKAEALLQALGENAAASREEPGCHKWEYSQHLQDPNKFAIYELYENEEAIQAHYDSDHFQRWIKRNQEEDLMASKQSGQYRIL